MLKLVPHTLLLSATLVLFVFIMIGVDHFRWPFGKSIALFLAGRVLMLLALAVFTERVYAGFDLAQHATSERDYHETESAA